MLVMAQVGTARLPTYTPKATITDSTSTSTSTSTITITVSAPQEPPPTQSAEDDEASKIDRWPFDSRSEARCRYDDKWYKQQVRFNVFMARFGLESAAWCERLQTSIANKCWRKGGKNSWGHKDVIDPEADVKGRRGKFEMMRCEGDGKDKYVGRGHLATFELGRYEVLDGKYSQNGMSRVAECVADAMVLAFPGVDVKWREKQGCYAAREDAGLPI